MSGSCSPLELLAPALGPRPILTLNDLHQALVADRAQLWTSDASAIYTQITDYHGTNERVIEVGPAGGSLTDILANVAHIEAWARAAGCTQAHVIAGRRGWARTLRDQGFEEFAVTLRKVLT